MRGGEVPLYAADPLVRRAAALQQTQDAGALAAGLNPAQTQRLGLAGGDRVAVRQNGGLVEMGVVIDGAVADGCVRIPSGVPGSEALGPQIGAVTLEKV